MKKRILTKRLFTISVPKSTNPNRTNKNKKNQRFIQRKCVMYGGAMDCCVFKRSGINKFPQICIFGPGSMYQKCTSTLPSASVPSLFSRLVYMWKLYNKSEANVCIHENKLSKRSISCV